MVLLVATVQSATVNVAPGADTLGTAVNAASSGDILVLTAGSYDCGPNNAGKITIDKPLTINGAKQGVDARGGSTVGLTTFLYDGSPDAAESTVWNTQNTQA